MWERLQLKTIRDEARARIGRIAVNAKHAVIRKRCQNLDAFAKTPSVDRNIIFENYEQEK